MVTLATLGNAIGEYKTAKTAFYSPPSEEMLELMSDFLERKDRFKDSIKTIFRSGISLEEVKYLSSYQVITQKIIKIYYKSYEKSLLTSKTRSMNVEEIHVIQAVIDRFSDTYTKICALEERKSLKESKLKCKSTVEELIKSGESRDSIIKMAIKVDREIAKKITKTWAKKE